MAIKKNNANKIHINIQLKTITTSLPVSILHAFGISNSHNTAAEKLIKKALITMPTKTTIGIIIPTKSKVTDLNTITAGTE